MYFDKHLHRRIESDINLKKKKSSSDFVPLSNFGAWQHQKWDKSLRSFTEFRLRVYERDICFIIRMKTTLQMPCILNKGVCTSSTRDLGPPMSPFYTVSHPNPSSSPGYPNFDLMMASRGRNMSSYN